MKLPKVFKNKWIKASRGGKLQQGNGVLFRKKDNSYCCSGVACKVARLKLLEQAAAYFNYEQSNNADDVLIKLEKHRKIGDRCIGITHVRSGDFVKENNYTLFFEKAPVLYPVL